MVFLFNQDGSISLQHDLTADVDTERVTIRPTDMALVVDVLLVAIERAAGVAAVEKPLPAVPHTMTFGEHTATITYDPEIECFVGEFSGINGRAYFYGQNTTELQEEGARSLGVFFEMCAERGLAPLKDRDA